MRLIQKFKKASYGIVALVMATISVSMPYSGVYADCEGPKNLAELQDVVGTSGAGLTVTLCGNISGSGEVVIRRTVTINLNNHSITSKVRLTKQSNSVVLTVEGKGDVSNITFKSGRTIIKGGTYTSNPSNYVGQNYKAYSVGGKWNVETKLTADNFDVTDIAVRQGQADSVTITKPDDSTTGAIYQVVDGDIATVTDAGVVTGVAVGSTTINVRPTYDNTIMKTMSVKVLPVLADVDADNITVRVGQDETIVPSVKDASITGTTFAFESADEDIATVDDNGKVTGVSVGNTTVVVTARYTDAIGEMVVSDTVDVTVYDVQAGKNDDEDIVADTVKEIVDNGLPENMDDATDEQKEAFGDEYKDTGMNLKNAINAGAQITTVVEVKDSVEPSNVTKTSIENAFKANGIEAENIEYFDVSVEMRDGNTAIGNLHKLNDEIKVVLADVKDPEQGYTREYFVVKYHNGIPTLLKKGEGFVIEDGKIKIFSDEFSIFAVSYQDTRLPINTVDSVASAPDTGVNTSAENSSAVSSNIAAVLAAISAIVMAGAVKFAKRK